MKPNHCLWLTRYTPYPPEFGGDILYSANLIENFAEKTNQLTVICYSRNAKRSPNNKILPSVNWEILHLPVANRFRNSLKVVPAISAQFLSPALESKISRAISETKFDAIIIDHIGLGAILPAITRSLTQEKTKPIIVYLSHNHEASLRLQIAKDYKPFSVKKTSPLAGGGEGRAS